MPRVPPSPAACGRATFLSIATTHASATDLGYLLHKHPGRLHEAGLSFGRAVTAYPEAHEARCEFALALDIDPVALVRDRRAQAISQYVNDRPYAASSFLSVAIAQALRTAMAGRSKERQALAEAAIPLEAVVAPVPLRGGEAGLRALFDMPEGALRHPDHRFEWTRPEFEAWARGVGECHGYGVALRPIATSTSASGRPLRWPC